VFFNEDLPMQSIFLQSTQAIPWCWIERNWCNPLNVTNIFQSSFLQS